MMSRAWGEVADRMWHEPSHATPDDGAAFTLRSSWDDGRQ